MVRRAFQQRPNKNIQNQCWNDIHTANARAQSTLGHHSMTPYSTHAHYCEAFNNTGYHSIAQYSIQHTAKPLPHSVVYCHSDDSSTRDMTLLPRRTHRVGDQVKFNHTPPKHRTSTRAPRAQSSPAISRGAAHIDHMTMFVCSSSAVRVPQQMHGASGSLRLGQKLEAETRVSVQRNLHTEYRLNID